MRRKVRRVTPISGSLQITTIVLAVLAALATGLLWNRLRGPRSVRLLQRTGLLVFGEVMAGDGDPGVGEHRQRRAGGLLAGPAGQPEHPRRRVRRSAGLDRAQPEARRRRPRRRRPGLRPHQGRVPQGGQRLRGHHLQGPGLRPHLAGVRVDPAAVRQRAARLLPGHRAAARRRRLAGRLDGPDERGRAPRGRRGLGEGVPVHPGRAGGDAGARAHLAAEQRGVQRRARRRERRRLAHPGRALHGGRRLPRRAGRRRLGPDGLFDRRVLRGEAGAAAPRPLPGRGVAVRVLPAGLATSCPRTRRSTTPTARCGCSRTPARRPSAC